MRRAFTLIELLAIVAIIAIMVSAAVVNFVSGQEASRLKAATRDIYAVIRHARSVALVSQQPAIITYSTERIDDEVAAKVVIDSAKLMTSGGPSVAMTLEGKAVNLDGDDEAAETASADAGAETAPAGGGQTIEEILFEPIRAEVVKGIRLQVLKEGESLTPYEETRAKPKISVFSNVDYLIGRYQQAKAEAKAKEAEEAAADAPADAEADQPEVSIVWEVNGRTEPHRIYVYPDGKRPEDGFIVCVDRFGAIKVLSEEDDE